MRYSSPSSKSIAIALALVAPSLALPGMSSKSPHLSRRATPAVGDYVAPGPNDVRSPCPGLNSLSNHGYLPRDGRNIHATDIITAMNDYLGLSATFDFLQTFGAGVRGAFVLLPGLSIGLESYDALTNSHNKIEHDASFTRSDVFFDLVASGVDPKSIDNNNIPPMHNPPVNTTLIDLLVSFSKDGKTLTVDDIADARHARLQSTVAFNPTAVLQSEQTGGLWREAGFVSLVLGDANGTVRIDWLRDWFVNERLPIELGWKKPNAGIFDILSYANTYEAAEKVRNGNNVPGGTPELPIQFGSVL
ncbi:Peroxidase, family 2-domain-containing protein [Mycena alexandri]|uniref:Peroxidase, family 2-domain-containing protein n=1 Tax=Mycena alexandri TaxID=1745969 RepID=A0AAD6TET2_9AGAR|nr:Peroxidase, family 2-domain-containing protein [Mycena alexandri]